MTTGGEKAVLIVVAGGSGARFGGDKLMVPLRGKPVFVHTLERLAPAAKRTVLVVPAGREAEFERAAAKYLPGVDLAVTAGGASRSESVARGVEAAKLAPGELAAIHDAARPLAAPELLRELCRKAREVGGAVPGFPQTDAQKRTDANGLILDDLPRENVWNVGTPRSFGANSSSAPAPTVTPAASTTPKPSAASAARSPSSRPTGRTPNSPFQPT